MSMMQLLMARARTNHQSSAGLISSLLMHMDGTNGSIVFTDANGTHTMTRVANAVVSTAQSKFGGASALFDGNVGAITTPAAADLNPGAGDFGFDCWVYQTGTNTQWRELFMSNVSGGMNIMLYGGQLTIGREGIANDVTAPSTIPQNAWVHLEVSRKAGVVYLFVNGTLAISQAYTQNFPSGPTSIGGKSNGSSCFDGYIDELRYINGQAIHTANFTPPTSPYTI